MLDAVGNRTRMTDSLSGTGWAGAGVTEYTYDNLDRLTRVSRALGPNAGPRVHFSYDTASRMTSISRTIGGTGTAVTSTLAYDTLDRLSSMTHQVAGGATLATYAYAYDVASRLTSETNAEGTVSYSYDSNAQLLAADRPGTADDEAYTYDRNGNRTMAGYATGASNRLMAAPGFTYTYDHEGNRVTKVQLNGPGTSDDLTTTYAYDHRNRLTSVTTRNATNVVVASANFRYDPLDRRIRTNLDSNGAAPGGLTTTWTAYDGIHAYADFASNGALQTRYLHGPAIDMILARTSAAGVSAWYLTDRQGSVRDLVSTSGAVLNHVVYDAYGRIKSETNPANGDRFKFTGRETDAVTGLQSNRARYYDAVIGRWTQEDPIGYAAGDANLYRYVGNGPTNATDPTGQMIVLLINGKRVVIDGPTVVIGYLTVVVNPFVRGEASPEGRIGGAAINFANKYPPSRGGLDSGSCDIRNAARHGFWQLYLSMIYGTLIAEAVGILHEAQSLNRPIDSWVDHYNNSVARELYKALCERWSKKHGLPTDYILEDEELRQELEEMIAQSIADAIAQGQFIVCPTDQRIPERLRPDYKPPWWSFLLFA